MKKNGIVIAVVLCALLAFAGCAQQAEPEMEPETQEAAETVQPEGDVTPGDVVKGATTPEPAGEEASIEPEAEEEPVADADSMLVAAAASLEYSLTDELIPMFEMKNDGVTVEGTYDSSGKLQAQIEEGLQADVFMSAATKQMDVLVEEGLLDGNSVVDLLENEIVLIAPADSDTDISSFAEIVNAEMIALGDPESVPAGQYAQEALQSLGVYDEVAKKTSFGANVTEVLNWVAEGSAEVGIVYATDAATTDKVKVLAAAPEGSLAEKVVYPVGIVTASENKDTAQAFVDFLQTPEAMAVFEAYGFKSNL